MSMNLKCRQIDVIQTPTYITRMCLYADLDKRKKSPWRTVMEKYLTWVTEEWGNRAQDWATVERERLKLRKAVNYYGRLDFEEV